MASPLEMKATLQAALKALYHHPDPQTRKEANQWLQEFQRSTEAWQVSDSLLHESTSSLETLIFCSQTLKAKVQRNFEDLPSSAFVSLRESLKNLLKKYCKGPSKVRTQISIAMAALAVHVSAQDWGSGGHLNWLKDELGTTPEYIPSFLELLTVMPQEAYSYKIAARPERRRQFQKELVASVEFALDLLRSCLAVEELHEQVLDAFSSWLRLSNEIPATTLASHGLVHASIAGLNSEKLFDAAVNALCELIRYTASGDPSGIAAQMPLIQVLVPNVMGLKPRFAAALKSAQQEGSGMCQANMEDEEIVKGMARLFAELGDAYAEMIATGSGESMMIVEAILEVTSHPDYDIAAMTFNFWHSLQLILTRREYYASFENDAAIDAEKERRVTIFRPIFEILVSLVCFRVTYPQNYNQWSMENLTDFKRTRYAVGDMLMDAASVLGGENLLKHLSNNFFQSGKSIQNDSSWDWRSLEASLYCIRAISRAVPTSEAVIMPQVMDMLPKLPTQSQLLHTACLSIAAYSKWLGNAPTAPSLLPAIIEVLIRGMTMGPEVSTAATIALRNVCDACRDKLSGSLEGLFGIYHKAVSGQSDCKMSTEDALQLIEALSMVITALPAEQAKRALESICMPIVVPLQQVITQQVQSSQQLGANLYTIPIDRIANIFRFVNHPEAVTDAFHKMWPILKALFAQRAWDMTTMERLCRACKYAVRTCGKSMAVIMGDMLQEVQMQYKAHHQPCFLYLSSEVIKVFGSDPSYANYLGGLITELFGHTIGLLTSIEEFTSRPDTVDDCFLLASRCIRYCSHLLIFSSIFPSLIDCAMTGITIQHREACQSILTFLTDIFDVAISPDGSQFHSAIDNVMLARGANLTRILIACLVGALPESRIEEVIYVLLSLTRTYAAQVIHWSQEAISLIPLTVITNEERSIFLQSIQSVAAGQNTPGFTISLEDLSDVCRRNKSTQEQVQGALQPLRLTIC